jgi:perosamine synthetase
MFMKVPLTRPWTDSRETNAVAEVVGSGWLTQGNGVKNFERAVAEHVGAAHAVAFTSCTTALHAALLLHGVGEGHEVIVPSYTWIATANVVRMVGAQPVFADIDLATFNINPQHVESLITPRTRVLMPVHQFGQTADMNAISRIAERHKLIVIEDAACALGSRYQDTPVGGLGNMACFSFHPRKLITTGEGGMLVTDDAELAAQARILINHGASVSDLAKHKAGTVEALLHEEFADVGYNYRMTDLQGALGVAQMTRLEDVLRLRTQRAARYTTALSAIPGISPPHVPDYSTPNWQSYAIRVGDDAGVSRNAVAQKLLDSGVACRPAYMACHLQPVYRDRAPRGGLPNTEQALQSVIILPLFPQMTDAEQDYVVDQLAQAMSERAVAGKA